MLVFTTNAENSLETFEDNYEQNELLFFQFVCHSDHDLTVPTIDILESFTQLVVNRCMGMESSINHTVLP